MSTLRKTAGTVLAFVSLALAANIGIAWVKIQMDPQKKEAFKKAPLYHRPGYDNGETKLYMMGKEMPFTL